MNSFLPESPQSLYWFLLVVLIELAIGYVMVNSKRWRLLPWLFPALAVAIIHVALLNEPSGFRMLALIVVLLMAMKIVTAQASKYMFSVKLWLLYALGWVGMDPSVFFSRQGSLNKAKKLFKSGFKFIIYGILILVTIRFLVQFYPLQEDWITFWSVSLFLLISLSSILHFGLLNINAGTLNILGYPAYSLFRAPLKSTSLKEFWGKRWNLAFTEMTRITVYKPLAKKTGPKTAFFISFLLSGLLHEVALTLSVQKAYGLPILYFFLHGSLVLLERVFFKNKKPGIAWVLFWLVVPLPLLFHKQVLLEVFWKVLSPSNIKFF